MFKKVLSFVIVCCLIFTSIPLSVSAAAPFESGTGSVDDPYVIATAMQLDKIRNYSDSHFILKNDIEFTEEDFSENGNFYNDSCGWIPIKNFSGSLNGNGFTIAYLYSYVESKYTAYAGLIAENSGTVSNLNLYECYVVADSLNEAYAGAIAAVNTGTITQCYSHGYVYSVKAYSAFAGGICGKNTGTVSICMNYAMIDSEGENFANDYYSGGIAGLNTSEGILTYCYNYGYIYGKTAGGIAGNNDGAYILICQNKGIINKQTDGYFSVCSGGIAGRNENGSLIQACINSTSVCVITDYEKAVSGGIAGYNVNSQIADCYNTGKISSRSLAAEVPSLYTGGIVGINQSDETNEFFSESIYCVYNTGETAINVYNSATKKYRGGLAGDTNCHLVNAYYVTNIAFGVGSKSFESDAIYLKSSQMSNPESFKGFDFDNMWWLHTESGYSYPQLTLISEKPATGVSLQSNTNTVFIVGNEPDFSGGTMSVHFENGNSLYLDASKLIYVTEPDINKIGEQTIYAIYAGHPFQFRITYIKENPDSIVINKLPDKLVYLRGEELDLRWISLSAIYDDFKYFINVEEADVTYDKNALGDVEVTINYKGASTSFNINVVSEIITRIAPESTSIVLQKSGDNLIMDKNVLTVYYKTETGGYQKKVNITPDMLIRYDPNKLGWQSSALVCYEGYKAFVDICITECKPGDVNGDTTVDTADLANLKLYLAQIKTLPTAFAISADFDCSSKVDTTDLATMKLHLANIR